MRHFVNLFMVAAPTHPTFCALVFPDGDEYDKYACDQGSQHGTVQDVEVDINVQGSSEVGKVSIDCDTSLILLPANDGTNTGTDIFKSVYGQLYQPDGPALLRIH
jgi:hypothetical protein